MRFILSLLLVLCLAVPASAAELTLFCGAGLIKPMEELRLEFEKKKNISIQTHYGSSGELFGMLGMGQRCDVFVPGAAKYTKDAIKNGWLDKNSMIPMVLHIPTIAVPAGNPAKIKSLDDLTRPGVRVALGDPKAPAIGKVAKKMLTKAGLWEGVTANTQVYAPTVNQLLIYVTMGQVDAAICWLDVTAWGASKGKVETVEIDKPRNMIKTIPTAVSVWSKDNPLACEFNSFLASKRGLEVWKKWGFTPCGG